MNADLKHYKYIYTGEKAHRWVLCDTVMPEDVVREMMGAVEPVDFRRTEQNIMVMFYAEAMFEYELTDKVRAWEKQHAAAIHHHIRQTQAAESRKRFEEYYASLEFD